SPGYFLQPHSGTVKSKRRHLSNECAGFLRDLRKFSRAGRETLTTMDRQEIKLISALSLLSLSVRIAVSRDRASGVIEPSVSACRFSCAARSQPSERLQAVNSGWPAGW